MPAFLLRSTLSLLVLLASVSGAREEYLGYCNSRFSFCVDVPAGLKEMPPPTNDDGRTWRSRTGAEIRAWGGWNALDETLAEACAADAKGVDSVVLQTVRKDWCVVSGFRQERIVYQRRHLAAGRWVVLRLEYPVSERGSYDGRIGHMGKSLQVLDLPDSP